MPVHIPGPQRITAAGNKPKTIDEYVGRVNSATEQVSVAHMTSPSGWEEPGQRPEFDEYTVVLKGMLRVTGQESNGRKPRASMSRTSVRSSSRYSAVETSIRTTWLTIAAS